MLQRKNDYVGVSIVVADPFALFKRVHDTFSNDKSGKDKKMRQRRHHLQNQMVLLRAAQKHEALARPQ